MKKRTILIIVLVIVALFLVVHFDLLEIIPGTQQIGIQLEPGYVELQPGECIALDIHQSHLDNIRYIRLVKFSDAPSCKIGISKTITSDYNQWECYAEPSYCKYNWDDWDGYVTFGAGWESAEYFEADYIYVMLYAENTIRLFHSEFDYYYYSVFPGGEGHFEEYECYKIKSNGHSELVRDIAFTMGGYCTWDDNFISYSCSNPYEQNYNLEMDKTYAIEFIVPDQISYSGLQGLNVLQHAYSSHHYPITLFGFSKTMTSDTTKWENIAEVSLQDLLRDRYNFRWATIFDDTSVVCQPGDIWYVMIKMPTALLALRSVYAESSPNAKFYELDSFDNPIELEEVPAFQIITNRDEPFSVDFTWSPQYPEPGETVQFTDQSHPELVEEWEWTLAPGIFSYQQNPTHVFNEEGTYTVTLVGISVHGTEIEINKQITVGYDIPEPPVEEEFPWWLLGLIGLIGLFGFVVFARRGKIF